MNISDTIRYACSACYVTAHDSSYPSKWSDHNDTWVTNWICTSCDSMLDSCPDCNSSGAGNGITVGGQCDLGNHAMADYWHYYEYTD